MNCYFVHIRFQIIKIPQCDEFLYFLIFQAPHEVIDERRLGPTADLQKRFGFVVVINVHWNLW